MSRRARRNHTPAFKAKVALAAIGARTRWLNWCSTSTFIPTRLCNGSRSTTKRMRSTSFRIGWEAHDRMIAHPQDRILIHGPKDDGSHMPWLRSTEGMAPLRSLCKRGACVLKHFQA